MNGSVSWRGVPATGVVAVFGWFGFYGQDLWMDGLGTAPKRAAVTQEPAVETA